MRWTWLQGLGRALIQFGRDAEAVGALRLAVGSNLAFAVLHTLLAAPLALTGDSRRAQTAIVEFRRVAPAMTLGELARRCAAPCEATGPLYHNGNERVLDGLRRASAV